MSEYAYGDLTNMGICGAVATAVVVTGSPWPLLGLTIIVIPKRGPEKDDSV